MILLDSRTGSGDLIHYLRPQAEVGRLEYGDAMLSGEGPDGVPVSVGVEVKQLSDVLKCMTDGRFAGHQLPGLIASYTVVYLLVEGEWRRDFQSGVLQTRYRKNRRGTWTDVAVGSRRFMWSDFDRWLLTMEMKGGVRVKFTRERQETAQFLKDLHWWWGEGWGKHKSHLAFDDSGGLTRPAELRDRALLVRPSVACLVAAQLPGLGQDRARKAARRFLTVEAMLGASEKDWAQVDGIGKTLARRIHDALRSKS